MVLCSSSVRTRSSLGAAMDDIGNAGYRDIDLLAINTWAHINPAVLAVDFKNIVASSEAALRRNNLTLRAMNVGFSHQMHDRNPESVRHNLAGCEAVCKFMNHFGVTVAALQPLGIAKGREQWEAFGDCLASLAEYYECAAKHGVRLGLELHANSPFESLEAMNRLFDKIPGADVIYDPSHFILQGMTLADSEFIMKNTIHVHMRDSAPGHMQMRMGEGTTDFAWIIEKLAAHGYKGHFAIEYLDNAEWDAMDEAAKMRDFMKSSIFSS